MSTTQWVMSITQHNRGGGLQVNFKRLKLYHFPATRSVRVKWLLHELLGDDFDVEVVPLYDCAQYSPEYLGKNPNHNVPSLEITLENGERRVMLESGAMVALLADIFPEKGLAPAPNVSLWNGPTICRCCTSAQPRWT